jgi:hypothetical protein
MATPVVYLATLCAFAALLVGTPTDSVVLLTITSNSVGTFAFESVVGPLAMPPTTL